MTYYILVNYNDLTVLNPGIMGIGFGESSPSMSELFRLVKYYKFAQIYNRMGPHSPSSDMVLAEF